MRNARSLLDNFLGQLQVPQGQPPATGGQAGAPIPQGTPQGAAGGLDLNSLLSGRGGLVTGAIGGGLAGLLLGGRRPRRLAGRALQMGGMALVGGLAYKAWQDWQNNQQGSAQPASDPAARQNPPATPPQLPPAGDDRFIPQGEQEQDDLSTGIIRAMIAAAKADGHISDEERSKIAAQLGEVSLEPEHMSFINQEMAAPLDIDAVAKGAKTPEQAAEIYAASLLCIDPAGAAEQGYLAMLAARLQMPRELVDQIHASVEQVVER